MLKTIRSYLSRRFGWTAFTKRVLAQRHLWDILSSRRLSSVLDASAIFKATLPPPLSDASILDRPKIVRNSLHTDNFTSSAEEYVFKIEGPVIVEPVYGYGIIPPLTLLDVSLPRSECTRRPEKMLDFYGLPSIREVSSYRKRRTVRKTPCLISLRFSHEQNYYHLLIDMLTRLTLLDEVGVGQDLPILVSRKTAELPFFQQMQTCGALASREWIVQDSEYIEADAAVFARTSEGQRKRLVGLADLLGAPEPDTRSDRRICIYRDGQKYGRGIINLVDLRPALARHNFEVIDPSALSFVEQMDLFSQARVVVGGHGAGLTNILFRRTAPMLLIELFPPTETPLHFCVIANALGHEYQFLVGDRAAGAGRTVSYSIDPEAFEMQLRLIHY